MKLDDNALFPLLRDFLKVYLPKQRKTSPHTVRSYRKSLESLLDYVKERKSVPLFRVTMEMLTADMILSFLTNLEDERGCSEATRNNRCSAIRAFLEYAADRDIAVMAVLNELKKVPFRKAPANRLVDYLSMEAITAIVEQTDEDTRKGFRDRTFLVLMYDSAARVQEMLDISLLDLTFDRQPKVMLHGKGRKDREIPLMETTVQYLKRYLEEFHNGTPLSSDAPLFYTVRNGKTRRLTDRAIRYMLQEYGEKARKVCPEIPENIHPHLFRHSRAMHLYQEGMDLTLISQWLGHSQLETTQIYAHADTEQKRKAIAASTPPDNPLYAKLNPTRYTITDEELLKRLTGLR